MNQLMEYIRRKFPLCGIFQTILGRKKNGNSENMDNKRRNFDDNAFDAIFQRQ